MAKKKKQIAKTEEEVITVPTENDDFMYSFFEMKMKPMPVSEINKIAQDLINWVDSDEEAVKLTQFWRRHKMTRRDFYRWCKKYTSLDHAHEYAMHVMGERREIRGLKGHYNSSMVLAYAPSYDYDFKELMEWKASLAQKNSAQVGPVEVVLTNVPSTDIVPPKKVVE